jgi:proline racemase
MLKTMDKEPNARRCVRTVDSHTEGNPTRVIVGGVALPPGDTLLQKQQWLVENDDNLRRLLCFEPRGGGLMCGVLVMPPMNEESDFSVIIMEQDAYVPMSGHCIIGTATTVVETGMVEMKSPMTTVKFDTLAGIVTCRVDVEDGRVGAVSFENVDSFLHYEDVRLDVNDLGELNTDIAYGGDYYAIVDADAIGLSLDPTNDSAIIAASVGIREAVAEQVNIVHPEQPHINQCYQVQFTSDVIKVGDYKQTIVSPPGAIDRSPCGTGTSARLAMLYARGKIALNESRMFAGILDTCFEGKVTRVQNRDGLTFVTPEVRGRAYITGYHQFVLAEDDPFPGGFRLGPALGDKPK